MKNLKSTIVLMSFLGMSLNSLSFAVTPKTDSEQWIQNEMQSIESHDSQINEKALLASLTAYSNAYKKGITSKKVLTVIDFSKPSTEKRLFVFDLKTGRTLINTWVAHGVNSGYVRSTSFSNTNQSLKSSLGVFVTAAPYYGNHGLSLRIRGLEPGFNDHAYNRSVVFHSADYVNPDIIRRYGRLGRSWGCPAVSPNVSHKLINTIKYNGLVVAYYPDRRWLSHSSFLA